MAVRTWGEVRKHKKHNRRLDQTRRWARRLKRQITVLWFSCRHPDTPWLAKAIAFGVVGYAFSPIDLIPDFIPVLGLLDDLILLPLGILLVIRLLPGKVIEDCVEQAVEWRQRGAPRPVNRIAAVCVVLFWLSLLMLVWAAIR
ncbi:YkvA family protein [Stutzerimonas tarimensis]|uniref:YkvA family protein n=1 Tax=Stutzerimonas tarimensis TaxID=1507735 RepID=A0ABV7T893_9GAMM